CNLDRVTLSIRLKAAFWIGSQSSCSIDCETLTLLPACWPWISGPATPMAARRLSGEKGANANTPQPLLIRDIASTPESGRFRIIHYVECLREMRPMRG